MKTTKILILPFLFLLFSSSVQAVLIQVDYTGSVTSVGSSLTGTFSVSDNVLGSLVYDTNTAQSSSSATQASYMGAITSYGLTIGSYSASSTGTVYTYDNQTTFNDGVYYLGSTDVVAAQVAGLDLNRMQLHMYASVNTLFTDLDLPSVTDLATLWTNNIANGNTNFMEFSNGDDVRYNLSNVTARVVSTAPEPSVIALMGLGLLGFVATRRKIKK